MIGERSSTENGTMSPAACSWRHPMGRSLYVRMGVRQVQQQALRDDLPRDAVEDPPQPFSAFSVHVLHPHDPAFEVGAKIGMSGAVLRVRPIRQTIVPSRLQPIIVGAST